MVKLVNTLVSKAGVREDITSSNLVGGTRLLGVMEDARDSKPRSRKRV